MQPSRLSAAPAAATVFMIHLEGEFDLAERHRLTDAFAIAQSAGAIFVDLSQCTFIDSSVLQCLVALHQACLKRGVELVLTAPHDAVSRLLEITQLDKVFDIRSTPSHVGSFNGAQVRRLTIESRATSE